MRNTRSTRLPSPPAVTMAESPVTTGRCRSPVGFAMLRPVRISAAQVSKALGIRADAGLMGKASLYRSQIDMEIWEGVTPSTNAMEMLSAYVPTFTPEVGEQVAST